MPMGRTIATDTEFNTVLAQVYARDLFYVFRRYHILADFSKPKYL